MHYVRHIFIGFILVALTTLLSPQLVEATFPGYNGAIIFTAINSNSEIYTINIDGSNLTSHASTAFGEYQGMFSYDGTKIAFRSNRDGDGDLYVHDIIKNETSRITDNIGTMQFTLRWSPNGESIFYSNSDTGQIYKVNLSTKSTEQLTSEGVNSHLEVSPDGTRLAYRSDKDGNYEIYTMDTDGGNELRLTNSPSDDNFPRFSPNGEYIAYRASEGAAVYRPWIMKSDGSDKVLLDDFDESSISSMSISPDNSAVLFSRDNQLWVIDITSKNATQLTEFESATDVGSAQWSPDGEYISFHANVDGGGKKLYVINKLTRNITQLAPDLDGFVEIWWQRIKNLHPSVRSDSFVTVANKPGIIDVLANDNDEETLDPINLSIKTSPIHGTASIVDGKVKYTPNKDYVGNDELTYQICDSFLLDQKCSTGVLAITVEAPDKPKLMVSKVDSVDFDSSSNSYSTTNSRPTFSGTADPFAEIRIEIHSDPIILTTQADANGNWSITPDRDIPPGQHTVKISATKDGVTTTLNEFVLSVTSEELPETGSDAAVLKFGGLGLLVAGSGLLYWQRRRVEQIGLAAIPPLFPTN